MAIFNKLSQPITNDSILLLKRIFILILLTFSAPHLSVSQDVSTVVHRFSKYSEVLHFDQSFNLLYTFNVERTSILVYSLHSGKLIKDLPLPPNIINAIHNGIALSLITNGYRIAVHLTREPGISISAGLVDELYYVNWQTAEYSLAGEVSFVSRSGYYFSPVNTLDSKRLSYQVKTLYNDVLLDSVHMVEPKFTITEKGWIYYTGESGPVLKNLISGRTYEEKFLGDIHSILEVGDFVLINRKKANSLYKLTTYRQNEKLLKSIKTSHYENKNTFIISQNNHQRFVQIGNDLLNVQTHKLTPLITSSRIIGNKHIKSTFSLSPNGNRLFELITSSKLQEESWGEESWEEDYDPWSEENEWSESEWTDVKDEDTLQNELNTKLFEIKMLDTLQVTNLVSGIVNRSIIENYPRSSKTRDIEFDDSDQYQLSIFIVDDKHKKRVVVYDRTTQTELFAMDIDDETINPRVVRSEAKYFYKIYEIEPAGAHELLFIDFNGFQNNRTAIIDLKTRKYITTIHHNEVPGIAGTMNNGKINLVKNNHWVQIDPSNDDIIQVKSDSVIAWSRDQKFLIMNGAVIDLENEKIAYSTDQKLIKDVSNSNSWRQHPSTWDFYNNTLVLTTYLPSDFNPEVYDISLRRSDLTKHETLEIQQNFLFEDNSINMFVSVVDNTNDFKVSIYSRDYALIDSLRLDFSPSNVAAIDEHYYLFSTKRIAKIRKSDFKLLWTSSSRNSPNTVLQLNSDDNQASLDEYEVSEYYDHSYIPPVLRRKLEPGVKGVPLFNLFLNHSGIDSVQLNRNIDNVLHFHAGHKLSYWDWDLPKKNWSLGDIVISKQRVKIDLFNGSNGLSKVYYYSFVSGEQKIDTLFLQNHYSLDWNKDYRLFKNQSNQLVVTDLFYEARDTLNIPNDVKWNKAFLVDSLVVFINIKSYEYDYLSWSKQLEFSLLYDLKSGKFKRPDNLSVSDQYRSDHFKYEKDDLNFSLYLLDKTETIFKENLGLFDKSDDSKFDYVIINNNGLFDFSNLKDLDLHFVVEDTVVIELSQLKDRFYEHGLLQKLIGHANEPIRRSRGLNNIDLYPEINLIHPDQNNGKLGINLKNQGGGFGRITIKINGKEVASDARGNSIDHALDSMMITYHISNHPNLNPGELNIIEVSAYNKDHYMISKPKKLYYVADGKSSDYKPTLHAIVVGSANYSGTNLDLNFPAKDAESFSKVLKMSASNLLGVDHTNIKVLTTDDDEADWPTKDNIQKAYEEVAKVARPYDVLVLYFAGHGVNYGGEDGDFYYLTASASHGNLSDPTVRKSIAISSDELTEWIKRIPALKQVLIFDACHSGQFAADLMDERDIRSSSEIRSLERIKERTGMFILSGSAADAVSYETSIYGQGLLTYSLLFGMQGASLRENKFVDVVRLFEFASDYVPELAKDIGGIQKPEIRMPYGGNSFDLGQLELSDQEKIVLPTPKPVFTRVVFMNEHNYADDWDLSETINSKLNDLQKSADAPIVFVNVDQFNNAYTMRGVYSIQDKLELKMNIFQNGKIMSSFKMSGDKQSEIVESLLEKLNGFIRD